MFSHKGVYNVCLHLFYIDYIGRLSEVLTDEQKSRKSLDASVKALRVCLCIVTGTICVANNTLVVDEFHD